MGFWDKAYNYLRGDSPSLSEKGIQIPDIAPPEGGYNDALIRAMMMGKTPTYDEMVSEIAKRTYDAAIPTGATADWLAWSTSGSYEALHGWRRICYLARDLERNNPHANAFLRDLISNILGSNGIRLQPKVKNLKGGKPNVGLNKQISDAYKDFRKLGVYDVTGQYTGLLADQLVLRALARDGGCLLRLYRGFPNKHRFAVQLLEIDALDLWYNVILENQNRVTTGVETDQFGRPVAYHLLKYAQSDLMANNTVGQRVRVPARDIVHVWLPNRITEVRGVSWFATVMVKLRMLDKYEEAVAIAQRIVASKMGYLERDKEAGPYTGQGQTPTGETIEEVSPGAIVELPPGVRFNGFDPGTTTDSYKDFRKDILRTVASGLGDQYNALSNDLESVNYSSARFGKDTVIEFWKALQTFLIDTYLRPVTNAWLECTSMAGNVDLSMSDMDRVQEQLIWRPRGWPYVDPVKDTTGAASAIAFGLSTKTRELAESGQELEEVYEELAYEKELAEQYDLTFVLPNGTNPDESTQEDPENDPGNTAGTAGDDAAPKPAPKPKPKPKKPAGKESDEVIIS
jgi:lambda family phage portal protein